MYLDEFNNALFKGKYRIKSIRHPYWDYSSDGYYFVTICTKNREEFFGEIKNGIMVLNEIGCILAKFWQEISQHFPFAHIDEWIIMPNHIHGVIGINNPTNQCRDRINPVSTADIWKNGFTTENNPMRKISLGRVVHWFKGRTSFEIHKNNQNFSWQSRFYDHIIRDEKSLDNIREYIRFNPLKWELDRNNPEGVWM